MRLYVKSVTAEKAMNDWPLGFYGSSISDNEDYAIATHYLKADEVPDVLTDSKTTSEFVAGLINAYLKGVNVVGVDVEEIKRMGTYVEEEDVPVKTEGTQELPF